MGAEVQSDHPAYPACCRRATPAAPAQATRFENRSRSAVAFFASLTLLLIPVVSSFLLVPESHAQAGSLPDSPSSQEFISRPQPHANPCRVRKLGAALTAVGLLQAAQLAGIQGAAASSLSPPRDLSVPCPGTNWYDRFTDGPRDNPLTPKDKAWLAARNVVDPINGGSIVVTSGIIIGANAHSPYGPGMPGFARNVGVAYAQDMTGEFFGTFLIPSIFHQNPHYHRMPHASIPRRLLNTCTQVFWTRGDNGKGMLNYANIIGYAIDDEIGNLYVPGRATNLPSSALRYGSTFLFEPTNNLVSEFLPDVAGRINTHYVFIQRIINSIKGTDAP
jgi:hypothetical protein